MQVASRPLFTAGVAAVGASLVVASTVAPAPKIHLPDIHLPAISTADVNLMAAVNPLAIYSQVLHDALGNVGTLLQNADPGAVIKQILANQAGSIAGVGAALGATGGAIVGSLTSLPGLVQSAIGQLAAGNISGAANTLLTVPLALGLPLTNLVPALATLITKPLENIVNVVKAFTNDTLGTELILAGFIAPLISTPAAAAVAVQNVISSIGTFNPAAIAGALLGAPATVLDGLLNGGYGPDLGPLTGLTGIIVKAGGLLSSSTLGIDPSGNIVVGTGGPLAALEQVLKKIAGALAPQPAAAVKAAQADPASVPATAASTVTLNTGSAAASLPAKSTPSAEPAANDSTATDATKPADIDTPKDSTAASGTTSATSTGTESDSTTKDSTTKPDSADASGSTKPAGTGSDTSTGTKGEPQDSTGSSTTKPGDTAGSTTSHETGTDSTGAKSNAASGDSSAGADKGGHKGGHAASHAHASK